jgi:hypothetical protein
MQQERLVYAVVEAVGFAGRELDVEKLSKLKTPNSRLPCLEFKAGCRGGETARIENSSHSSRRMTRKS